jgi:glycosyltransferase involved in cell wall biosynthesis
MKVLHVVTQTSGGAFTGAYRLHKALLKSGVSSKILVRDNPTPDMDQVVKINPKSKRRLTRYQAFLNRIGLPKLALFKKSKLFKNKKGKYEFVSVPFSDYDITSTKEFQEADIVHLQWFANFLDYASFFKKSNKPLVITLRDLFPLLGVFHYENDSISNRGVFGGVEKKMIAYKKKAINGYSSSIQVVGISNWITEKSRNNPMFEKYKHRTIHNCINSDDYQLYDKIELRKSFNISDEAIVFCFVSESTSNLRKGLDLLAEAILMLENTENIVLLTVGGGIPVQFPFHICHRHLGKLNQKELNKVFSVSDAFIFPTKEEALGNVMLEAMACGTPVVGTPVGGLLDVIKTGLNGVLASEISAEGLKVAPGRIYKNKKKI